MLTIALPKGGLLKDCIERFQRVGLDFSAFLDPKNRQLQITDPTQTAKALLVRTHDVPVYVEYGQAHWLAGAMVVFSFTVLVGLSWLHRRSGAGTHGADSTTLIRGGSTPTEPRT